MNASDAHPFAEEDEGADPRHECVPRPDQQSLELRDEGLAQDDGERIGIEAVAGHTLPLPVVRSR